MIPLRDFLVLETSIYHKSWAVIPWQVISWGLTRLGLVNGPSVEANLSGDQFVLLENVEVRLLNPDLMPALACQVLMLDRRLQKEYYSWSPLEPNGLTEFILSICSGSSLAAH